MAPATTTKRAPHHGAKSSVQPRSGLKSPSDNSASASIDARINGLGDWRGRTLSRMRTLIKQADPEVLEEWKWVKPSSPGVPVWYHAGLICTGEVYKDKVKMTFARGASLEDPAGLFNSSLEGHVRRAIDLYEGDRIEENALKALIRAAVALNTSRVQGRAPAARAKAVAGSSEQVVVTKTKSPAAKPKLLAGGNPQIAKGDGDAPVQSYLASMPGWKGDVGRRLDALIVRSVPDVRKAIKWNSPFYGIEGQGWFLSFHCFTKYVKVTLFRGSSLRPLPPGKSKHEEVRYLDIHENEPLDEKVVANWIRQAAKLP